MMLTGRLTVPIPGRPLQLSYGINEKYGISDPGILPPGKITLVAIEDNANDLVCGGRWLDAALASREGRRVVAAQERVFLSRHLCDVWVDVVTADDGVYFDFEAPDPPRTVNGDARALPTTN